MAQLFSTSFDFTDLPAWVRKKHIPAGSETEKLYNQFEQQLFTKHNFTFHQKPYFLQNYKQRLHFQQLVGKPLGN